MDTHLQERKTFGIETNLADVETWKFLLEVQKQGYAVHVMYISSDNIPMLDSRIEARTLLGDHYVNPQVVRERYINGLHLLKHYFEAPDKLQLIDNSEKPVVVLEAVKGHVIYKADPSPLWIERYVNQNPVQEQPQIKELNAIEDVRKRYEQLRSKK
jgi:predicted ABC-type ATPase